AGGAGRPSAGAPPWARASDQTVLRGTELRGGGAGAPRGPRAGRRRADRGAGR
ncbi:MAG: hypothetical protein AVDCRST_MAG49-2849, partial [uncultured Thermomicrobiales bacterium]